MTPAARPPSPPLQRHGPLDYEQAVEMGLPEEVFNAVKNEDGYVYMHYAPRRLGEALDVYVRITPHLLQEWEEHLATGVRGSEDGKGRAGSAPWRGGAAHPAVAPAMLSPEQALLLLLFKTLTRLPHASAGGPEALASSEGKLRLRPGQGGHRLGFTARQMAPQRENEALWVFDTRPDGIMAVHITTLGAVQVRRACWLQAFMPAGAMDIPVPALAQLRAPCSSSRSHPPSQLLPLLSCLCLTGQERQAYQVRLHQLVLLPCGHIQRAAAGGNL